MNRAASSKRMDAGARGWPVDVLALSLLLALVGTSSCGGSAGPSLATNPAASAPQPAPPRPRIAGRPVFVLQDGHTAAVTSVAFSPDSRTIATGSKDTTVRLWDAATGALKATLEGHTDEVVSVTFGTNGQTVASSSADGTSSGDERLAKTILWDAATGAARATLRGHSGRAAIEAYSPDGQTVASVAGDQVLLWDTRTGVLKATLQGNANAASVEALSPDGNVALEVGDDRGIRLWDSRTGTLGPLLVRSVWAFAFTADGRTIATRHPNSEKIELRDAASGAVRAAIEPKSGPGTVSLQISPDGRMIAGTSMEHTVGLWDASTGALLATFDGQMWEGTSISSVRFRPDGKLVALVRWDAVSLWDTATRSEVATLEARSDIHALVFSPDSRTIVTAGEDKTVRLWDGSSGALRATLEGHSAPVRDVAMTPDSQTIASASVDGTVRIWDAATGAAKATFDEHWGTVHDVAFGRDGRTVVSHAEDGIMVHRLLDGAAIRLAIFDTPQGPRSLVYTPNGLFTGDEEVFDRVMFRVGDDLRTAEMLTADQLFESFHRPSLMQDFHAGRPLEPLPEARAGIGRPPAVEFAQVPEGKVATERVGVKVRATDRGGGVSEIRVFVNGARPAGDRGVQLAADASALVHEKEVDLFLVPGENVITAEAYNVLGHIRGPRIRQKVTLHAPEVSRPKLHLLAVTLAQYTDPSMQLGYANADGDAVVKAFLRQQGRLFESAQVERIRDAEATVEGIEHAIDRIAGRARPSDVLLMFASGHGGMVQCPGEKQPGYRLVTYRATLRSQRLLCAEALSVSRLAQKLRTVAANKKLLVLDTCQAGGASSSETLLAMRGAAEVDTIKRLARAEGLAILSAATEREQAYEVGSLGHGLFTYALLRGLDGGAAFRGEQHISVFGLLRYVDKTLPALAQQHTGRQQMPIYSTQGQDFPIFALRDGDAPLVETSRQPGVGPATPTADLSNEVKKRVRAHIEARRHGVLACADAPALAIRATITADGHIRFAPHERRFQGPVAECLDVALGALRVDARGASGVVVHPVQR